MVLHAQTCYSTDRWSHTKIQIFLEINPVFPNFSIPHNAFTDAHRLLFTSKLITKLIHRGLAIWRNHQERMKKKTGKNTQIWSLSLSYHWFHLIISLILPCHLTDFTMRNQWDDSMKKVLWQRFLSFFQCQNCTKNSSKTAYKCSSLIIRQLQKHPKIRIFQGKVWFASENRLYESGKLSVYPTKNCFQTSTNFLGRVVRKASNIAGFKSLYLFEKLVSLVFLIE